MKSVMDTSSGITCCILGVILSIFILIILMKSMQYLLCKKSLTIDDKHVIVHTISKYKKTKIKKKTLIISFEPYIRYITIFSLSGYLMGATLSLYFMFTMVLKLHINNTFAVSFAVISTALWYISRISMTSIFIKRLKYSFANTKWMLSIYTFKCLYILLLSMCAVLTVFVIFMIIQLFSFNTDRIAFTLILFALLIILDITCSIMLILIFQRKVFQLITSYYISFQKMKNISSHDEQEDINKNNLNIDIEMNPNSHTTVSLQGYPAIPGIDSSSNNNNLGTSSNVIIKDFYKEIISESVIKRDDSDVMDVKNDNIDNKLSKIYNYTKLELINTMTQYWILIALSLLTSLIVLIRAIIHGIMVMQKHDNVDNFRFYCIFSFIIDSFINSLCLYLHFPFSLRLYKAFCGARFCLHKNCLLCVGKCIDKTISESNQY